MRSSASPVGEILSTQGFSSQGETYLFKQLLDNVVVMLYLMIMDLILTRIWQVLRVLWPGHHPPGILQGAVDRVTCEKLRKGLPLKRTYLHYMGEDIELK